ncbi:MAG: hypothetical protein RUMPE_01168 [Eubacteriales bacterium SKADARSKE-1]|nr:hypothetical protein [Eubacteriales bacterium SKADARSKE-1]
MKKILSTILLGAILLNFGAIETFADGDEKIDSSITCATCDDKKENDSTIKSFIKSYRGACISAVLAVASLYAAYKVGNNNGYNNGYKDQPSICGVYQDFKYGIKYTARNAYDYSSYGLGEVWDHKKEIWDYVSYGLGKTWDGTKYVVWNAYDYSSYGLGKSWNATKHMAGNAYDYSSYGLGKAWNATSDNYCGYIGIGCDNFNNSATSKD